MPGPAELRSEQPIIPCRQRKPPPTASRSRGNTTRVLRAPPWWDRLQTCPVRAVPAWRRSVTTREVRRGMVHLMLEDQAERLPPGMLEPTNSVGNNHRIRLRPAGSSLFCNSAGPPLRPPRVSHGGRLCFPGRVLLTDGPGRSPHAKK